MVNIQIAEVKKKKVTLAEEEKKLSGQLSVWTMKFYRMTTLGTMKKVSKL